MKKKRAIIEFTEKGMPSYLMNCYIKGRIDDALPIFFESKGKVFVRMDGYLIVPRDITKKELIETYNTSMKDKKRFQGKDNK